MGKQQKEPTKLGSQGPEYDHNEQNQSEALVHYQSWDGRHPQLTAYKGRIWVKGDLHMLTHPIRKIPKIMKLWGMSLLYIGMVWAKGGKMCQRLSYLISLPYQPSTIPTPNPTKTGLEKAMRLINSQSKGTESAYQCIL